MFKKISVLIILIFGTLLLWEISNVFAAECGNGIREGLEQCDNGENNSDTIADACRTDCTRHKCGDDVKDSDEECDEGYDDNSDEIPGRCRTDCTAAKCGDGVLDYTEGEICDDGNDDVSDGCHNCYPCYVPKDNLVLSSNYGETFEICPGTYKLTDEDNDGIIIINGSEVTLECKNVTLIGIPARRDSAVPSVTPRAKMNVLRQKSTGSKAKISKRVQSSDANPISSGSNQGGSVNSLEHIPADVASYQGTGIVVNGNDVIVTNCEIKGFKQGIKLNSTGAVLVNNKICGNEIDIKSDNNQNYGVKNSCAKCENWQENGQADCMSSCN